MSANCSCEQQLYRSRNLWKLERERKEGGGGGAAGARGDTGRIVPLSDSPFSLISSRSSYRKPDRKKKSVAFYSCVSPISLSCSIPLFHSLFILVFIETPFFSITVMKMIIFGHKYFPCVITKAYYNNACMCAIVDIILNLTNSVHVWQIHV